MAGVRRAKSSRRSLRSRGMAGSFLFWFCSRRFLEIARGCALPLASPSMRAAHLRAHLLRFPSPAPVLLPQIPASFGRLRMRAGIQRKEGLDPCLRRGLRHMERREHEESAGDGPSDRLRRSRVTQEGRGGGMGQSFQDCGQPFVPDRQGRPGADHVAAPRERDRVRRTPPGVREEGCVCGLDATRPPHRPRSFGQFSG
jgi:hypothetical protein